MPRALWNHTVVAASDDTVVVEGNHYFPEASVDRAHRGMRTGQVPELGNRIAEAFDPAWVLAPLR